MNRIGQSSLIFVRYKYPRILSIFALTRDSKNAMDKFLSTVNIAKNYSAPTSDSEEEYELLDDNQQNWEGSLFGMMVNSLLHTGNNSSPQSNNNQSHIQVPPINSGMIYRDEAEDDDEEYIEDEEIEEDDDQDLSALVKQLLKKK